jgi:hypothetical protein
VRTQGIGHDIPGCIHYTLIIPQGVIMKSRLPDTADAGQLAADCTRRSSLQEAYSIFDATVPELNEPMQMIRHDDESQGYREPCRIDLFHRKYDVTAQPEITQESFPATCSGRDDIDLANDADSATTQSLTARTACHGAISSLETLAGNSRKCRLR